MVVGEDNKFEITYGFNGVPSYLEISSILRAKETECRTYPLTEMQSVHSDSYRNQQD